MANVLIHTKTLAGWVSLVAMPGEEMEIHAMLGATSISVERAVALLSA